MTTQTVKDRGVEQFDLIRSIAGDWFKLPLAVMADVGPASQTLAGFLQITNRETFCSIAQIAERSRVPKRTAQKHLKRLEARGWLENRGRESTRRGWARRTCTLALTPKARVSIANYAVLPWWACCRPRKGHKLTWAEKAVLSIVLGRLMSLVAVARQEELDDDDMWGGVENLGGNSRFRFSLEVLSEQTGLDRKSIVAAKYKLKARKIIRWVGDNREDGGHATDMLVPNREYVVTVSPASEGRVYVDI